MVVDAEYGTPLAIMSGEVLTAIRTGAACGAATDALARRDASRVAIFGSGNQAATQLEAMCTVRAIRTAAVFDTDRKRADAFAARMSAELKIAVGVAETPRAALADADIVCTATTSNTAVFDDADLAPGTHINAIGVYKPWKREIPGATVARARVVVDSIPAAWDEAGDLILAREEGLIVGSHVYAELGEILDGRMPGREQEDQITLFKSVGIANQDLSAAHVVLTRGAEMGLGTPVKL
jgi:ornithine cyclodeaminase/alanine dehydrogenase-like protein (mu-crystallin family)